MGFPYLGREAVNHQETWFFGNIPMVLKLDRDIHMLEDLSF